ncbi:unnamed protein product, partial [Owenia fusiformis]
EKLSKEHVKLLKELGHIYKEIGDITNEKMEYVKSIAIYECAMVHCEECHEDDIEDQYELSKRQRNDVLEVFISSCTHRETSKQEMKEYGRFDNGIKVTLTKIRNELKAKLRTLDTKYEGSCFVNSSRDQEKKRIEEIATLFKWIHGEIKTFISHLVTHCARFLGIDDKSFAFIAFGSFSRKETTPFSDVEFAIVQDSNDPNISTEEKKNALNLAMLVHIKLLTLGETVLPAMDIGSLEGWYYDDRQHVSTKQGMSFDGLMSRANKTPYFTDETVDFSLTDTKKAFVNFFHSNHDLDSKLFLYKGDFETLYGDDSVANEMKNIFKRNGARRKEIISAIRKEFKNDLKKYSCTKKIYDAKFEEHLLSDKELSVKKELYRLPSVVINNLLHLLGSKTTCIWDVKGVKGLSDDNLHNLTMILTLATEFRLRCYAENNGQVDEVKGQLFPDVFLSEKGKSEQFIEDLVLRYYMTAIPLVSSIEQHSHIRAETGVTEEQKGEALLKAVGTQPLYDASLLNHAMAYLLIRKQKKAKEYLGQANTEYLKRNNPVDHNKLILQILLNMYIKDAKKSKEFLNHLGPRVIDTSNSDVVNTLGNALIQRGEPNEAEKVLKECANKYGTDECYKLLTTALVKNGKGEELQKILTEKPELQLREVS